MTQQTTFVRAMINSPRIDLAQRTIGNCVVASIGLASDGWIILPSGIDLKNYLANPVVTSRHIMTADSTVTVQDGQPLVIARCLAMTVDSDTLVADIQFADTRAGREYAYLYGLNDTGPNGTPEVFMRAWSIEGIMLNRVDVTFERAKALCGRYWDEQTAARVAKVQKKVAVCGDFAMLSFAAVATGADKNALTRASSAGIETAGAILARMDLTEAGDELAELKKLVGEQSATIARLDRDLQALRGEGASAAARSDSEAILAAVREIRALFPPSVN